MEAKSTKLRTSFRSAISRDSHKRDSATIRVITIKHNILGDMSGDSVIDLTDLSIFGSDWGHTSANWLNPLTDLNNDGTIDLTDFSIFARNY